MANGTKKIQRRTLPQDVPLADLVLDKQCQPRASIDKATVQAYRLDMEKGDQFPPAVAYQIGDKLTVADGFHRIKAAALAGMKTVSVIVKPGTLRDAILHSVGCNAAHGQRRTNNDKQRAVDRLLRDKVWGQWTNSEIAKRAAVSDPTVAARRKALKLLTPVRKTASGGTIDTSKVAEKSAATKAKNAAAKAKTGKPDKATVKANKAAVRERFTEFAQTLRNEIKAAKKSNYTNGITLKAATAAVEKLATCL